MNSLQRFQSNLTSIAIAVLSLCCISGWSLSAHAGGIYVGDVRFYAKEVCSRELTSTFSFNSGCLPPTRVSNVQNYFFEDIRLPISHDEAQKLDNASRGYLVDKATDLVQASAAAGGMSERLDQVRKAIPALSKVHYADGKLLADALAAASDVADTATSQQLKDLLGQASGVAASSVAATSGVGVATETEFDGKQGHNPLLDTLRKPLGIVAKLADKVQQKIKELNMASSSENVKIAGPDKYQSLKTELAALASGKTIDSAISTVKSVELRTVSDKLKAYETQADALATLITDTDNAASTLAEGDSSKAKILAATQSLKKLLDSLQAEIQPVSVLESSLEKTASDLAAYNVAIKNLATVVESELLPIAANTDEELLRGQLRAAAESANGLTIDAPTSSVHLNLLPSLIGRVFVTENIGDASNPRYKVPEHNGNFQFLPLDRKDKVTRIPTEVLISSDLEGVIQKNVGASGTLDMDQLVGAALKAAGIAAPKITTNLKAALSFAISRTSMGSGNYYYVSMSADELDKLTGKTFKDYLSVQPIDRDETRRSNEATNVIANGAFTAPLSALGIDKVSVGKNQGLGIITGVAILRTRSGRSEVCSSREIDIYNPAKSHGNLGSDSSACAELRAILAAHGVANADISAALSSLNAGYRRESYKTLKIGDHASVLAIHWLPIRPVASVQ